MMILKKILFFITLTFSINGVSQFLELSPLSKVSLLTVGTGDELSSQFGHTAIRIQDPAVDFDIVFGYGGFDFEDPNFYYKFTTGKLDYRMTANPYQSFVNSYKPENRWVSQQVLNLSAEQKKVLFDYLKENYREENRAYKYDFLFDNCATKIPEVFSAIFDKSLNFDSTHIKKASTFRQLIHETLDTNSWATFGIDLALGSVIDKKATSWQHQFLPLYVQQQFDHLQINGKSIVSSEKLLLAEKEVFERKAFVLSPLFCLITLFLVVVLITYRDHKKFKRSRWLDFALFLTTGIAGLLIFFLWFATDHSSTKGNFNILWAFTPNLIIAFYFLKKELPAWISRYLWIVITGILVTAVLWLFKIQIFSPLLIFILVALGIRYLFLINHFSTSKSRKI